MDGNFILLGLWNGENSFDSVELNHILRRRLIMRPVLIVLFVCFSVFALLKLESNK